MIPSKVVLSIERKIKFEYSSSSTLFIDLYCEDNKVGSASHVAITKLKPHIVGYFSYLMLFDEFVSSYMGGELATDLQTVHLMLKVRNDNNVFLQFNDLWFTEFGAIYASHHANNLICLDASFDASREI